MSSNDRLPTSMFPRLALLVGVSALSAMLFTPACSTNDTDEPSTGDVDADTDVDTDADTDAVTDPDADTDAGRR